MKRVLPILLLCVCSFVPVFALDADEQMRFADGIYLRGFYENAVGEYLILLRDYPGSSQEAAALYRIGECYRQMGNAAGAERFYKRVLSEYPEGQEASRAALRCAEMVLASGQPEDAKKMLKDLLDRDTNEETRAAALYQLGSSNLKAGTVRSATSAFKDLLEQYPDSPYAAYAALDLAAMNAGKNGSEDEMRGWFDRAVRSAGTPGVKAEALFRWGDWAYRRENYQEAADMLQTLLVEMPNERRARDARLAAAWSLYYLDRAPEALEMSEQLEAGAEDAETAASGAFLRANCLRKMNRDGEALQAYQTVVEDYPGAAVAQRAAYEIMVTHFKRGRYEKALVAAPAQPDPEQAVDVLWMRAESERELGRTDLAMARYERLRTDYPDSDQAASAMLRLGEMAREAGRLDEAAELFRSMAEKYPDHPAVAEARKASALARLRTGDTQGALSDWDQVISDEKDAEALAEARLQKALVLIELKKTKQAMKELDQLLADEPDGSQTARACYWRGVLLSESSEWEEAERALRSGLAAAPDAQTASLARLRLAVVLQRQGRMDEAADQIEPLLKDGERVAENPALVEWLVRRRFEQGQYADSLRAAEALADNASEPVWRQIGWHWAGASQSQLGNEVEALSCYQKAVDEKAGTREGAESQLLLAGLELKAGHLDEAFERFSDAAASASDQDALDLRARAYFGLGETEEVRGNKSQAARHFMSVAVLFDDPEWTPQSLYRAGVLYGETGDARRKKSAWDELLARYPDSSFALRIRSMNDE